LEIPVRVVFNDHYVKFHADFVYIFPALNAKCSRCWVLANPRFKVNFVQKR